MHAVNLSSSAFNIFDYRELRWRRTLLKKGRNFVRAYIRVLAQIKTGLLRYVSNKIHNYIYLFMEEA